MRGVVYADQWINHPLDTNNILCHKPHMPTAEEQIYELQRQIENLKSRSTLELRVKLAEAKGQVIALEKQLEALTGNAPTTTARKHRVSITIEQVVAAIREGAVNYPAIAAKLGCSPATVATKIRDEGKKAGIKSTGERANFKLGVK